MRYLDCHVQIKKCVGLDGYLIDNFGVVYSEKRGPMKVLRTVTSKRGGYPSVMPMLNCKNKTFTVHRLVMDAFVGPRSPGMECRHIDGNPGNNAISNLAWGTRIENRADMVGHGTSNRGSKQWGSILSNEDVLGIRKSIKLGDSIGSIASRYGVSKSSIYAIRSGRNWSWLKG